MGGGRSGLGRGGAAVFVWKLRWEAERGVGFWGGGEGVQEGEHAWEGFGVLETGGLGAGEGVEFGGGEGELGPFEGAEMALRN